MKAGGRFLAAHPARWILYIVLGAFGAAALTARQNTEGGLPLRVPAAMRRRLDSWPRRGSALPPRRPDPPAARVRRPVVVIRLPHLHVPLPRPIDRYISRMYLRVVGLSFLALLGLFYISTFIDKSDKIFKGQATTGNRGQPAGVHDAAVRLLRDPDCRTAERARDVRAAVANQRADGDESLRRESVPRRAPGGAAVAGPERRAVRPRAAGAGQGQPPRRHPSTPRSVAERPDLFDIMNRQWVVGQQGTVYHYSLLQS